MLDNIIQNLISMLMFIASLLQRHTYTEVKESKLAAYHKQHEHKHTSTCKFASSLLFGIQRHFKE